MEGKHAFEMFRGSYIDSGEIGELKALIASEFCTGPHKTHESGIRGNNG